MENKRIIYGLEIVIVIGLILCFVFSFTKGGKKKGDEEPVVTEGVSLNLSTLTLTKDGEESALKVYKKEDYDSFLNDYQNKTLPEVYATEFLFDGAGMVKSYDLDDFVESGNNVEVDILKTTAFHINRLGDTEITGSITGGMIAVDTNGVTGNINLVLNDVTLDTDSKKVPAIYVYNKDSNYTGAKVTIVPKEGTVNKVEGGKFKKVSLIAKEELGNYTGNYSGDASTWYNSYTNYYGVYTISQIENILFAKVVADEEGLRDGDPYYFYKGSGAISSDIDLYFEGKGTLEVTSKNDEGIESKGNLTFSGGVGNYAIFAKDDCLNTTTDSNQVENARNTLTINVESLTAAVDLEADEGDAIDSNGELIINGGRIIALAHPGQDAGIDSSKGTYLNGGTVITTGDMYDEVKDTSKQNFMVLSFGSSVDAGTTLVLLNANEEVKFAYETDRAFTTFLYTSPTLYEESYTLYKDGTIEGTKVNGYYTNIGNYTKGTLQGYSSRGGSTPATEDMAPKEMDNGRMTPPEMRDGMNPNRNVFGNASNKDFNITGISNLFQGVGNYAE